MKYFLMMLLASVLFGTSTGNAVEQPSAPPLPSGGKLSSSLKEKIKLLDQLLKSNQLPDFYQELFDFSFQSGKKGWKENSMEEQYASLLYCFYTAKAPLIPFSYDEKVDYSPHVDRGALWDSADIVEKESAAVRLLIISHCDSNILIKNRAELGRLSASYFAAILKCLRDAYSPTLEEELKAKQAIIENEIHKNFEAKWKPWFEQEEVRNLARENGNPLPATEEEKKKNSDNYKLFNHELGEKFQRIQRISLKMGIMEQRNGDLPRIIKSMEKDFLTMLVNYFPGRKGEVVKYIRMAGYEDNEINDLVDRNVGREAKTEFLYKGRSKKDAR